MTSRDRLSNAIRTVPDFPKPGIGFKDIMPIIGNLELMKLAVEELAQPYLNSGVTSVVGIESRGFLMGTMLAARLGVGFVPVRKSGKLPGAIRSITYDLEYGTDTIEIQDGVIDEHSRVLIHDDVLATGGTASACYDLVSQSGATVVGCSFLMELHFLDGRGRLPEGVSIHAVLME